MAVRPRQSDVARLAGVSRATVSYVLNDRTDNRIPITEKTRQRVLEAAKTLGYEPNAMARSLRVGTSRTIGFLMPAVHNPHYWAVLEGAEEEITARGYHFALVVSNLDPERERNSIRTLFQQRLDGLILMPTFMDTFTEDLAELRERSTPVVFTAPFEGVDWVIPDVSAGAEQMMDHLLSLGHRRIGFINGAARRNLTQTREDIYRQRMRAAGLPLDEDLIRHCGYLMEDGYRETCILLDRPDCPTAIWSINDLLAVGALRAVHEYGLCVPDDVALAGFDDIFLAEQLYPPLTTVHMPAHEMGHRAVQILFKRLEQPKSAIIQEVLATKLIIRQSTTPGHVDPISKCSSDVALSKPLPTVIDRTVDRVSQG